MMRTQIYCIIVSYVIGLSDKITHMAVEKRQFHSNRLLLFWLLKKLTALSDIFLTFGSYAPDC